MINRALVFGVEFYDQVLRELLVAVGAALFLGNGFALMRRRRHAEAAATHAGPDSSADGRPAQLTKAPVARTVTFMLIGLIVMVWGIASLIR